MASISNPNARVLRWNDEYVTISCPYCMKTHRHGLPEDNDQVKYEGRMGRLSHCHIIGGGGYYTMVFPFDVERNLAGYEINKQDGTFVSANFMPGEARDASSDRIMRSSETHVSRQERPQFSDASTTRTAIWIGGKQISLEQNEVKLAILYCVSGKVRAVKKFLKRAHGTDDYKIFLHGEDEQGNTALCLAAMETSSEMVALLLREGSNVNARNREGRTPLMEAAIWGRPQNTRVLLEHNADKTLRDHSGRLAIDLAQSSSENEEERYHRVRNYQEVAFEGRHNRQQIIRILETPLTQDQLFGFPAVDNQESRVGEIVASLDRGALFPRVNATRRGIRGDNEFVVGDRLLKQLVTEIAELVNYQECSASHASKQLIAYFIDKHVFLPNDIADENEVNDLLWQRDEYGGEEGPEEERKIALTQLKRVQPPVCLKSATLLSSTAACPDCEEFCRRVNDHFGLQLFLHPPKEDWFIPREEVLIGEEIAAGSFAKVYLGKWHETEVVVKRANCDAQSDGERREFLHEMFLREVRIWRRARHPHVLHFLGAYHDCSSWFIVSENASCGTLPNYLYKRREDGRLLIWLKLHEVALGLHFLHEQKIVHSDLKGNNILVRKDGTAMVSDFGLSFEKSGSCAKIEKWGAIRWRPPEYMMENGTGPSFAGDVYSLGMCIVEAVTGQPPWRCLTDCQVKACLWNKEMMPRPPEMSDPEWQLVERMCMSEPSARMPLADVIQQLESLANKERERDIQTLSAGPTPLSTSRLPKYAACSATASDLLSGDLEGTTH